MRTGDNPLPTSQICRYVPGRVRDGKDSKDAVALLPKYEWVRMEEVRWRRFVVVNPVLYAS